MSDHQADDLFRQEKYEAAAARLSDGLAREGENGRDRLIYLLDLGLAQHAAGRYAESNQTLLEADRVAEIKDYTSLATESATLLTSDNIKDYKGEDFENVLISTYLAMNYALLGDTENALVEARRVNRKLERMVTEGERKYKQNAFARYLSAILYEGERDFNNAYVDYKMTYELDPDVPGIGQDLLRMAKRLGLTDDIERWETVFKIARAPRDKGGSSKGGKRARDPARGGEIVVLYENGISPIKRANPDFYSLPKFYARANPVRDAEVKLDGQSVGRTYVLHDIEATAIENLEEKYGGLVAKKIGGVVAKEVVADQIGRQTNSPILGLASKLFFYLSDQADVRSWNLLPRDLQILRIPASVGEHEVMLTPGGATDAARPIERSTRKIKVEAGRPVFVNFRYMP